MCNPSSNNICDDAVTMDGDSVYLSALNPQLRTQESVKSKQLRTYQSKYAILVAKWRPNSGFSKVLTHHKNKSGQSHLPITTSGSGTSNSNGNSGIKQGSSGLITSASTTSTNSSPLPLPEITGNDIEVMYEIIDSICDIKVRLSEEGSVPLDGV